MQNLTKLSKIFLSISIVFFGLWLGSYIIRQIVIYQLFDEEISTLKSFYDINSLKQVLYTILPIFVFNIFSYSVFIVSVIAFLFLSKIKLKNEGWLFISILVVFLCAPFEIYLLSKDFQIARLIYGSTFDAMQVIQIIKLRLIQFGSFSLVEIVSFISIIFLAVFQPLKKSL